MKTNTLIIIGLVGAALVALFWFSKRNKGPLTTTAAGAMPGYGNGGYGGGGGNGDSCYDVCEVAQNEMACVACELGPEDSACYAECNIAKNDVACDQCLGALDYEPAWLSMGNGENGY